ncbi:MAG: LytTR family transcriptional regulator DNA-binding domain-containing protein [Bacteroidetes bacterium]|nr:LytTR family transcriptional regulator DNA-binding domain-containing protein [Bacteroidota bacterium]MDA1120756.1 LytTR family transcriptional regulator DNA-binding domain-containing protein [Bacteroidota bacterium]
MIRVIIIDDEPLAREMLMFNLELHKEVIIIAECENGFDGVKAIQEHSPDLVFLDIQMPKITGFEMLELIDKIPEIIFCTAYDQFAIKAFEKNAVDYLLKPYSQERFNEALIKAYERIKSNSDNNSIARLKESRELGPLTRIVVRTGSKIDIIDIEKIVYIEAADDYVTIHSDGRKFLKQMTMKYLEDHLPSREFIRCHRSYIIAIGQLKKIEQFEKDSHLAILHSDEKIPVSRLGYGKLRSLLDF